MKVSVLMGIYNTRNEKILETSLKSILNQTFSDFELIICDDGSTNDCLMWAKRICNNDNRVKFLKNESNKGLAYTLNKCLEVAEGEYIARMDDDDKSHLDRFKKQVDFLDNNPDIDLVGSNMNLFDDKGIWGERKYKEYPKAEDFLYRVAIAHPTIMCRKKSIKDVGGYRDLKKTLRVEDYDLFMRMFANGSKIYNFQEPIFDYREDGIGSKKKKYKYRLNEAKVRYEGFKALGLLPKGFIYVVKPFIAGVIPQKAIKYFQRKK